MTIIQLSPGSMSGTTKYRVSHEVHPFTFCSQLLESIDGDFWESESEVASTGTSSDETDIEAEDHTSSNEDDATSSSQKASAKGNTDKNSDDHDRPTKDKEHQPRDKDCTSCTSTKRVIYPENHSDQGLIAIQRKAKKTKKSPANAAA